MGGHVIVPAEIQTKNIIVSASFLDLRLLEYVSGLVTARYRSTLIAQSERMDAVHRRMSKLIQMSHRIQPNSHLPVK